MESKSFPERVNEWNPVLMLLTAIATAIVIIVMVQGNIGNRLNSIDTRFDMLNARLDTIQAEGTRQFEALRAENNRQYDALQAERNRRFDEVNRRFDGLFEAIRAFESRVSRLEGVAEDQ